MRRKKDYRKVPSSHSAMVLERKVKVQDLAASLAAQRGTVAAGLEEELRCVLEEGEEMPDLRFMLELLERRLRLAGDKLDRADEERWLEVMRTSVARFESQGTKDELYAETVKVRKELVECFGSKRSRLQFGLSKRTPRGMIDLAFEARRLVDRLSHPELELPKTRLRGLVPDPKGWVACLRPSLEPLEALVQEIAQRRVAVIDGIAECQRALESCDATYLRVARTAEAIFVLAGQPELARRLRPCVSPLPPRRAVSPLLPKAAFLAGVAAVGAAMARFWAWLRDVLGRPVVRRTRKIGLSALAGRIPAAEIA